VGLFFLGSPCTTTQKHSDYFQLRKTAIIVSSLQSCTECSVALYDDVNILFTAREPHRFLPAFTMTCRKLKHVPPIRRD